MAGILSSEHYAQIEEMLSNFKKDKNLEFEVSFKNISYITYINICKQYINLTDNITSQTSLDASIILENRNTYRVSFLDEDAIESFVKYHLNADTTEIQKYLLSLTPSDKIEIIYKDRGSAITLYVEDLDAVFKTIMETEVTKSTAKPKLTGNERILFRSKRRYSFGINKHVRMDISDVQASTNLATLARQLDIYEVEMEVLDNKISMKQFVEQLTNALTVIQDTFVPIGKSVAHGVVQKYQYLLNIKESANLESRNVISIEPQHIVKFVPNKYAVTEKADGERYFLFVLDEEIYLLSTNLDVKKVGIKVANKKFNNVLLDGELIKLGESESNNPNSLIFLAFDVVFANNIDYRFNDKYNLTHRIVVLNNIIDECFGTLIPFVDYTSKYNDLEFDKIRAFYTDQIKKYWGIISKKIRDYSYLIHHQKSIFRTIWNRCIRSFHVRQYALEIISLRQINPIQIGWYHIHTNQCSLFDKN